MDFPRSPSFLAAVIVCVLLATGAAADTLPEDKEPEIRTVLELSVKVLEAGQEAPQSLVVETVPGPPNPDIRRPLGRDDLPFALSLAVGILDPDLKVAEIHLYRTEDGPLQEWTPFEKLLIDDRAEVLVEPVRGFTLVLEWVDLRQEALVDVQGEIAYRPLD